MNENFLEAMLPAYLEAALWSTGSDDYAGLEVAYSVTDIPQDERKHAARDCEAFGVANFSALSAAIQQHGYTIDQAGHDFWLSRNGHGAGFFDRGLGEVGDALQRAAEAFPRLDLYIDEYGKIRGF